MPTNVSSFENEIVAVRNEYIDTVRPSVPLTQLVVLDFREVLDSTVTKVVSGYLTREFNSLYNKFNRHFRGPRVKFELASLVSRFIFLRPYTEKSSFRRALIDSVL